MGSCDVVIYRVGLVTAVGMGAAQTTASITAGIDGFAESAVMNAKHQPLAMALLPDEALPPLVDELEGVSELTGRQRRMLRLVTPAIDEVLAELPANAMRDKPPLLLATPEKHPNLSAPLTDQFLDRLALQSNQAFDRSRSQLFPSGRAGGFRALDEAAIRLARGTVDYVLVGGVDTHLDLMLLATLDQDRRLLAEGVMDGFIPGEGAGLLLLGREGGPAVEGLEPIARIPAVHLGQEYGHRYSEEPYQGEGLAMAFAGLFESPGVPREPVRTAYLGFNGESFPAKEWGVASMRSSAEFSPELDVRHPADCFGDIGAAFAPVMLGLAALGVRAGSCPSPCIVWTSSEGVDRGAALVDIVTTT